MGADFGLTPKKYQSGEIDRTGRISKVGDAMARTALDEAANVMLTRAVRFSALKAWALRVAGRHGMRKAKVALARKLAVVMHRMWLDGTTFRSGEARRLRRLRHKSQARSPAGGQPGPVAGTRGAGEAAVSGSGRFIWTGPRVLNRLTRSV